jgi:hypothetical protein
MSGSIASPPGKYQSAQDWLDALSSKACDEDEFVRASQELIRKDKDGGWDLLSLLDQYYRRGKITTAVFRNVKFDLERSLLGATDGVSADPLPAPRSIDPSPARAAGPPLAPVPPRASAGETAAPRDVTREVAVGDVLRGRYQITNLLYQGGTSTLFEAIDQYRLELPNAARRLAIKVPLINVAEHPELLAELRREFQRLQSLSHPNIVRVHDYDRDCDTAFFTMEYLSGLSLRLLLAARHQAALNRSDARSIIRDVGAALAHAHQRGIVHGDLSPRNIFITDEGNVKVLDFGGERRPWISEKDERAQAGAQRYASCQLLEGKMADFRDDLYTFGCVVYLLLAGKLPFGENTAIQARALRLRPTRPDGLTQRQWRALRSSLSFEREGRPAGVEEFLEPFDLRETAARLPALATLFKVSPPQRSRKRWPVLAAAALILLGGGWWVATNYDSVARTASAWSAGLLSTGGDAEASLTKVWHDAKEQLAAASSPEPVAAPAHPAAAPPPVAPAEVSNAAPARTAAAPASSSQPESQSGTAVPHVAVAEEHGTAAHSRIELAANSFEVLPGEPSAHIVIRRSGSLHAETSFSWWTESGTAKPRVDYEAVSSHVETFAAGKSVVNLFVPVVVDPTRQQPKNFYVVISDPGANTTLGARTLAMVTIEPSE